MFELVLKKAADFGMKCLSQSLFTLNRSTPPRSITNNCLNTTVSSFILADVGLVGESRDVLTEILRRGASDDAGSGG